jgi:hypothetical protein
MRELAAILINVNRGKNSKIAKANKIYPLSIDDVNDLVHRGFDQEAAKRVMEQAKKAGWLN